jgi:hypothetical protein
VQSAERMDLTQPGGHMLHLEVPRDNEPQSEAGNVISEHNGVVRYRFVHALKAVSIKSLRSPMSLEL